MAYQAVITHIHRDTIECAITKHTPELNEPRRQIYLAISLLKHSAKFDILVEKGTELGVSGFIPIITERCERKSVNLQRLRGIAVSATKQSLRCRIPEIREPMRVDEAYSAVSVEATVMAHEKISPDNSFAKFLTENKNLERILILVGPEGGFTDAERDEAERKGACIVSLGERRLRAETAAILAIGMAAQLI